MSRKSRRKARKALSLQTRPLYEVRVVESGPTFCGNTLNVKRVNQLWNWKTLEDVKF